MRTILILEEDRPLREAYRELLEGEGFEVLEAGDPTAVMSTMHGRHVDVLLADVGAGGW